MSFSTKPRHLEQILGIEPRSRPYQGRVITDYTITAYFVPQTGLEPAHSDFKPDTTTNYATGAFNLFVPLPELESGHYASKAHTTTNYVIEANITEESLESGFTEGLEPSKV